jgi:hypothetical protein
VGGKASWVDDGTKRQKFLSEQEDELLSCFIYKKSLCGLFRLRNNDPPVSLRRIVLLILLFDQPGMQDFAGTYRYWSMRDLQNNWRQVAETRKITQECMQRGKQCNAGKQTAYNWLDALTVL